MDPIPPLTKVFSLFVQDEKQRKVGAGKKSNIESATLVDKNNNTFVKEFNKAMFGRPQCTHYGILGHVGDKYYVNLTHAEH